MRDLILYHVPSLPLSLFLLRKRIATLLLLVLCVCACILFYLIIHLLFYWLWFRFPEDNILCTINNWIVREFYKESLAAKFMALQRLHGTTSSSLVGVVYKSAVFFLQKPYTCNMTLSVEREKKYVYYIIYIC